MAGLCTPPRVKTSRILPLAFAQAPRPARVLSSEASASRYGTPALLAVTAAEEAKQ
jgi:hypothetical protein